MKISKFIISLVSIFSSYSIFFTEKTKLSAALVYKTIYIENLSQNGINATFAAKFTLFISVVLLTTLLVGKLFKRLFKLPIVAGQIIGGIILGPSLINIKNINFFVSPLEFVDVAKHQIYQIASSDLFFFFILLISSALTVAYLLWLAGHETDIADMAKVGLESTLGGILGAILPILIVAFSVFFFLDSGYAFATAIGIGIIFSPTSVSIPVAMLISQNKMNLRSSKATMGAAIVDDILAVILFSFFIVMLQGGLLGKIHCLKCVGHSTGIFSSILYMLLSFFMMFLFGRYFIVYITKALRNLRLSHILPTFATIIMLSFFSLSELVGGLAGITGAYFAGFFHRMGDTRHKAVRAISPFVNTVLLPIFLGSIGMQVNITILRPIDWLVVFVILFAAVFSKMIGCNITTLFSNLFAKDKEKKWSFLESYLFGSSMVARGEVSLVIATILKSTCLMTSNQYVICVSVIVLTTITSPIMMALGFNKLVVHKELLDEDEFCMKIGPFSYLSTRHMFDVISMYVEQAKEMNPIIELAEGNKILTLEKGNVEIILYPDKGIIFKGDEHKIREILDGLKSWLSHDVETIPEM
ncbi:cation:proton antiporter [Candidatus Dependentiae bacterium]